MEINVSLPAVLKVAEIMAAIMSMHNGKSQGSDGMNPLFYKTFWNVIGDDVTYAIQDFFKGDTISRVVNHTFLTLIPKRTSTNKVVQFRLIALCNVIYKIITKILATRLKD